MNYLFFNPYQWIKDQYDTDVEEVEYEEVESSLRNESEDLHD